MVLFIRFTQGLGDDAIYTRLRNSTGYFWDFTNLAWIVSETTDCRVWLSERDDGDSVESLYSAEATLPAGGPWVEEAILASSGRVIGYDNTSVPIESTQLTLKQLIFAYNGHAENVFSKVCGSFVGTIDFYVCSYAAFSAAPNDPAGAVRVCTLASTGVMSNTTNIATDGEVLFIKLSSSPAFSALVSPPVINIYSAANTGSTRVYVPLNVEYVATIGAYYPTSDGGLLIYENGNLVRLGETAYGKALATIPNIDWTRISQPVQLTTTSVIS